MRRAITISLLFLMAIFSGGHTAAQGTRPKIAILLFLPQNMEAISLMDAIPTLLTNSVAKTDYFEILERKKIEKAIELEGYKLNTIKMNELINIGNKLGLDFVITGDVQKERGTITAQIKVLYIRGQRSAVKTITTTEAGIHTKINEATAIIVNEVKEHISADAAESIKKDSITSPFDLKAIGKAKKITIKWRHNEPQNTRGFKVYRAKDEEGPFTLIGTVPDTTFEDENPSLTEPVFYRVNAVHKNGLESKPSDILKAQTVVGPPPPIILDIQSDIKSVHLTWRPYPGSPAANFKIYRKETGGKDFAYITSVPGANTTHTDKGLKDNITYYYALTTVDPKGVESDLSKILEVKTHNLLPRIRPEGGKIRRIPLRWDVHPSKVVEGYRIYRAVDKMGDYALLAVIKERMTNTYLDKKGLADLGTYWYRISALNKDGLETDLSEAVSVTTRGIPPGPQEFTAKNLEQRKVTLKWKPLKSPEDEIKGYYIFRAMEVNGEYKKIAEISNPDADLFIDKDKPLQDNTTYYYKIASYNSAAVSSNLSEPVSSTTKAPPAQPKGVRANSGEIKQVTLSWQPNPEKDIKEYIIFRSGTDKGSEKNMTARGKTVYIDTGLQDGAQYTYTLKAIDEGGLSSEPSPPVSAATKPLPAKPSGLTISDKDGGKILQWPPNPEKDVKQYIVYKKGFLGLAKKIATVQTNFWVVQEGKGKSEFFVTAVDESGLESEGSELIIIEIK